MNPKERGPSWKEYFVKFLNADILNNLMRMKKWYSAEPMISEVTEEETY